jgi:CrcB protein
MQRFLLISLGAVLGANLRYWVADWAARNWGSHFPLGTLLINLSGSFILGLFITLAMERSGLDGRWRMLVAVGFLGAYTTFSTYTYESVNLLAAGQWAMGLLYLLGSAILGGLAVLLGIWMGDQIGRLRL